MAEREIFPGGPLIRPLMLGGNVFGWTADRDTSFRILDHFLDHGFSAVDTADVYSNWAPCGGGASETVLGEWFAHSGKRDRVVLATKVGLSMGEGKSGLSARNIEQAVEASLRRLQTDYLDIYFAHRDDPQVEQQETLEAFARLVQSGKVRHIGASNYEADRLQSALQLSDRKSLPRYKLLQPLYNLYDRQDFEDNLRDLCLREGLGVTPYFALASGYLTGKYRSEADLQQAGRAGLVEKYLTPRGTRILEAMDKVAERRDMTLAQIAIAWLARQPAVTAPIASATSIAQLDQLIAAVSLSLNDEDLVILDEASRPMAGTE